LQAGRRLWYRLPCREACYNFLATLAKVVY